MKVSTNHLLLIILLPTLLIASFPIEETKTKKETTYRIPKVNSYIKVDAFLDEEIWNHAVKIDANIEVRPGENIDSPVITEVLMAYDDSQIFVAFLAYDPDPSKIRAHYCDRDQIFDDDWVLILFDTFNDQRRTYDFGCNPLGIQADFIETPSFSGGGNEWDAIWESDGRITDEGYIVEMAIPFSSLNFPRTAGDQIWGFDAVRSYPRDVRHHIGTFPRDRNNNCYMCQSEKLIGFAGASPGKNIEITPTVNVLFSQEREDETQGSFVEKELNYNPGITAGWGITPNLILNATLNPDFSNIEADILQLDINNQFAIYYPEKRPFFLESADFFDTPLQIVHTRTLADPNWGMKLSGREGAHTIGFFTVQDDITNLLFPGAEGSDSEYIKRNAHGSALRYKADIGKSSNVGAILTDRECSGYYNRLAGIDGDLKFTQKDQIIFQLLGSKTKYPNFITSDFDQPGTDFNGKAYHLLYMHNSRSYQFYALHRDVDQNFRADLGFITQANYRYTEIGGEYKWRRDPGHWYTWLSVYSSYDYRRDQSGNLLHKAWTARLNYQGPLQSHAHWYCELGRDRYNGKEFNINWMQGCFGLRPISPLNFHLFWRYGDQIDYANTRLGTRFQLYPNFILNVGLHLIIELDHTYETLNVDVGRLYTANVSRIKLMYQFNKQIFLRAILQYKDYQRNTRHYYDVVDSETKGLFSQLLFSFKINPQTVFFIGYSDDYYGDQQIHLTQTNRTLFSKIGYAITM
jgi:hypothetical protein